MDTTKLKALFANIRNGGSVTLTLKIIAQICNDGLVVNSEKNRDSSGLDPKYMPNFVMRLIKAAISKVEYVAPTVDVPGVEVYFSGENDPIKVFWDGCINVVNGWHRIMEIIAIMGGIRPFPTAPEAEDSLHAVYNKYIAGKKLADVDLYNFVKEYDAISKDYPSTAAELDFLKKTSPEEVLGMSPISFQFTTGSSLHQVGSNSGANYNTWQRMHASWLYSVFSQTLRGLTSKSLYSKADDSHEVVYMYLLGLLNNFQKGTKELLHRSFSIFSDSKDAAEFAVKAAEVFWAQKSMHEKRWGKMENSLYLVAVRGICNLAWDNLVSAGFPGLEKYHVLNSAGNIDIAKTANKLTAVKWTKINPKDYEEQCLDVAKVMLEEVKKVFAKLGPDDELLFKSYQKVLNAADGAKAGEHWYKMANTHSILAHNGIVMELPPKGDYQGDKACYEVLKKGAI